MYVVVQVSKLKEVHNRIHAKTAHTHISRRAKSAKKAELHSLVAEFVELTEQRYWYAVVIHAFALTPESIHR